MRIPLSQGKFAVVGPRDYAYLMQWNWWYGHGHAARKHCTNGKWRTILMHRVILERMGFKDFARSDHINRNRLDNRRCNLRPATANQNSYNQGKHKNNTSGYRGVSPERGKWRAGIQVRGKQLNLGRFGDLKEAAKAYDEAAIKYHGEFATLNGV